MMLIWEQLWVSIALTLAPAIILYMCMRRRSRAAWYFWAPIPTEQHSEFHFLERSCLFLWFEFALLLTVKPSRCTVPCWNCCFSAHVFWQSILLVINIICLRCLFFQLLSCIAVCRPLVCRCHRWSFSVVFLTIITLTCLYCAHSMDGCREACRMCIGVTKRLRVFVGVIGALCSATFAPCDFAWSDTTPNYH